MSKILIISLALSLTLLLIPNIAFAQCGPDGTQPCSANKTPVSKKTAKTTRTTSQKQKTTKKADLKNPDYAEFQKKIIGKWNEDLYVGELAYNFFADNTGNFTDNEKVCQEFTYSLMKDILIISNKSVANCGTGSGIDKWKISFVKNELRMVMLGSNAKPMKDEGGLVQYIWKKVK